MWQPMQPLDGLTGQIDLAAGRLIGERDDPGTPSSAAFDDAVDRVAAEPEREWQAKHRLS